MNTTKSARNKKRSTKNIHIECEQQLEKIIQSMDDNGRIGNIYVDLKIDDAIDSIVTAQNRLQAIIQYTSENNLPNGDID